MGTNWKCNIVFDEEAKWRIKVPFRGPHGFKKEIKIRSLQIEAQHRWAKDLTLLENTESEIIDCGSGELKQISSRTLTCPSLEAVDNKF